MNNSIIVHGPQGCGKTRNKHALKQHFGCVRILDDVHFSGPAWLKTEATRMPTLFLTNAPPEFPDGTQDAFRHVSVIPYDVAARKAGIVMPINQSDEE